MSGTFADRTNAIFAALSEPAKPSDWRLDTAQGFKPGAEDALDRDSSDAEEAQEPESLLGADDSDEEQTYRLKASSCYRRAFEREEEEDEFDRVAAGGSAQEQRPSRSMEVCSRSWATLHAVLLSAFTQSPPVELGCWRGVQAAQATAQAVLDCC